jgi:Protein of unknown function (DUF2630)
MEEQGKEDRVLAHIQALVAEEHKLYEHGSLNPEQTQRLAAIAVELDQYWDLLRQRRALKETGQETSQAHLRPSGVVEKYIG